MLSARLRDILNERNLTINEFAAKCDIPLETIRNIYYGKTPDPKLSTALKMAEALNLSVNCLMGKCPHTSAERAIIHNYRKCGKHGKALIELSARYQAAAATMEHFNEEKHTIRCIILPGEIGNGVIYESCENEEIETTVKEAFISIKITSNNLAPVYCKNDILLLENRFPKNGEKAAFLKEDRAYIRKFIEKDDKYILQCLHNQGQNIELRRMDEVDYIGTIIGVIRE